MFDETGAFRLLSHLSFPRLGGTGREKEAAGILRKYLSEIGLKPRLEPFKVQTYQEISASLEVLKPYHKKYNVSVLGNSGSTPRQGMKGEMVHLTSTAPEQLQTVTDKIVITYLAITRMVYQKLRQHKVKALIRVTPPAPALPHQKQDDLIIKAYGMIPSVLVGYNDGLEIVQKGGREVKVTALQKSIKSTSQNIIAEINGTEFPNEKVIICAHYDSVYKSPGGVDNGGGSVTIAEFARYFAKHPPRRTLRFIWFGSEELGLKGSWAYVKQHQSELKPPKPPLTLKTNYVKLIINVDVAGTVLGNNGAVICGADGMANFVESLAREKGLPLEVRHFAYPSDNIPFNEKGIPSIALNRSSGNCGHTPLDGLHLMSPAGLKVMGEFGLELVSRIANAVEIPFELSIPEKDRKFTYEYIERANPYYNRPP